MSKSQQPSIDEALAEGIQQARKKKARYFALIAKGPDVVGLIVQKKVISDSVAQKAKSEAKGNLILQGVCHGEGLEVRFEVLEAEPNIPIKKLKDYISDRTTITVKPQWLVVPAFTTVIDEDEVPSNGTTGTSSTPPVAGPAPEVRPPQGPVASPPATDLATQFNERLKAILPRIKAAAGTPGGDQAKLKASEAGVFARKNDFAQGCALLDQAEEALRSSSRSPADLFNERLKSLLPDIKAAAGTPAGDQAKLKASEAGVLARKNDFVQALALLDQAEAALKGVAGTGGSSTSGKAPTGPSSSDIPAGLVAKRKFLIERWKRIPEEVRMDLKDLRDAIERDLPEEDADLLMELSEDYLNDFYEDMQDALDEAINAGDAQYKSAIGVIKSFRTQIASEPLIQHLKVNTLGAKVTVESILLGALDEMEQALAN